jgi:methionyl-tRNA formyltransferase
MRVVFMGSPDFAVPCLRALIDANHDVALVVSQPDKPAGRGSQMHAPSVKTAALELGLPVFQPVKAKTGELRDALASSGAELAVVVAYGKILPPDVLRAVPRGCINVHGSLLPKYRGAAPIQWAVINGDSETGVAIMQLDEGMDTGPVFLERRTPIGPDETGGELFARLAPLGASALIEAIEGIAAGGLRAVPQDHARASHAPMLAKTDGAIDFAQPARAVAARIRGVDPWPGAQVVLREQTVKVFRSRMLSTSSSSAPGTIVAIEGAGDNAGMHVATDDGLVIVREIQTPGKKRMPVAAFAQGRGIAVGDVLSKPAAETT